MLRVSSYQLRQMHEINAEVDFVGFNLAEKFASVIVFNPVDIMTYGI